MKNVLLAGIVWVLLTHSGLATAGRSLPGDSSKLKERKMLVFPVVTRTPETSVGFGVAGAYTFRPARADSLCRTSSIQSLGLYTLNRQLLLVSEGAIYSPGEQYIFRFQISHSRFPDRFWGIGNDTRRRAEERYSFAQVFVNPQILRKVQRHLFAGMAYKYQRVFDFRYQPDGLFDQEDVKGRYGSVVSGAGLVVAWDRRNHAFSPNKGELIQLSVTHFDHSLGSDYNFTNYVVDLRKFVGLSARDVLAWQVYGNFNTGNVPIRNLATLGGSTLMRGYYEGRYRDNHMVGFQMEYRRDLWWRFGVVAFAGLGQVSDRIAHFRLDEFKYAVGGGIRFALKPKEKLNLRLDYGIARNSSGVYFMISEAF